MNLCSSSRRKRFIERQMTDRLGARTPDRYEESQADPSIARSLQRLPVRQRACIVLRYFEDRSESEMAEILRCSTGTVKSQLAKARAKLEKELRALVALEGDRDE